MSALLILCLCLTLLPSAAFAAYTPPVKVDEVSVSVTHPAVGGALAAPTVDSGEPYFIDSLYSLDDTFSTGIALPPRAAPLPPAISMRKAGPAL